MSDASPLMQPYHRDDARALLARLYREIGVAAVATALNVPVRAAPRVETRPAPGSAIAAPALAQRAA